MVFLSVRCLIMGTNVNAFDGFRHGGTGFLILTEGLVGKNPLADRIRPSRREVGIMAAADFDGA